MYRGRKISVVVPAYNEQFLIGDAIRNIPKFVDIIIVVDDASTDLTPTVLEVLKETYGEKLVVERHSENLGVGGAIRTGYKISLEHDIDIASVMAGDAQMDPKYLPALLDPIIEGKADYTKGNRLLSRSLEKMPPKRRIGNAILTVLTKFASGYWLIIDPQNGYTAASKEVMDFLVNQECFYSGYGYCNDILIKLNTYRFRVYDVVMPPVYGREKSGIKLPTYTKKLTGLLIKGFFWRMWNKYGRLNLHPILFFFSFGLLLTILGLGLGLYAAYVEMFGIIDITAGTSMLITLIAILGLQSLFFSLLFDELDSRGLQAIVHARPVEPEAMDKSHIPYSEAEKLGTLRYSLIPSNGRPLWNGKGNVRGPKRSWMHPIGLMYMLGAPALILGILLGTYALYYRLMGNIYSVPTIVLSSLLIIIGAQSIFFALAYEIELYRPGP